MQGIFAFQKPVFCPVCGRAMISLCDTDRFCPDHLATADAFALELLAAWWVNGRLGD